MLDELIRDDLYLVDKRDALRAVQGTLQGDRDDVPILTDGDRAFGVLNERGLVRSRLDLEEKLAHYAVGTKFLAPTSSLDEAVQVALTSGLPHVPVRDGDEVTGYVRSRDLALAVLDDDGMDLDAQELMKPGTVLRKTQRLGETLEVLRDRSEGVFPVTDEDGDLVGVLERAAVVRAGSKGGGRSGGGQRNWNDKGEVESRSDLPVAGLMTTHYATVGPRAGPDEIRRALDDFGYAVVVEGREPRGVLTPLTVLRALRG